MKPSYDDETLAHYFQPVSASLLEDSVIGPILRNLQANDPDVFDAIAEVDRSLIRANLELTPEERLARNARSLRTLEQLEPESTPLVGSIKVPAGAAG